MERIKFCDAEDDKRQLSAHSRTASRQKNATDGCMKICSRRGRSSRRSLRERDLNDDRDNEVLG
jgi:hypothetical protein